MDTMKLMDLSNSMEERTKKVHFSHVYIFHNVCQCRDHKSARNGIQWIQAAADQRRFRLRIQKTSLILDNVLKNKLKIINDVCL